METWRKKEKCDPSTRDKRITIAGDLINIDVYKNKRNYGNHKDSYYIIISADEERRIAPQVKDTSIYKGEKQELYGFDYEAGWVSFVVHWERELQKIIGPFTSNKKEYTINYINETIDGK